MNKPPLFFLLVIGLIVIFASFRFVQQQREKTNNDSVVQQQQEVVVSTKREIPQNPRLSQQQQVTPAGTDIRYEAVFKPLTGGPEMTFRVDAKQYHELTVGDKGVVHYKGTRFVDFTPEAAR
ncbi:DUF2500 domain-containing protein [Enterobacter sp. Bisph1]|uniref:DUF2500 domain-containing protein n=1 Tax=Enterobacter sp. Bisph1 TaxID=1274399 RepID=UPI00057BE943|nr:DUF2500 domain-containing protein [Enterobacter sp. Bisph1]